MINPMVRPYITHYTFFEARAVWERPHMDMVQMAASRVYPLYVVAEGWPVAGQPDVVGWVELDAMDLLKCITSDLLQVTKVKQQGKWHTLVTPVRIAWGNVFVDAATFERFEKEKGQEANTPRPKNTAPLLTAKEVAKRLGIQPDTLSKWRQQGKGPKHQKLGGTVRYSEIDVEEYLKSIQKTDH